MQSEGCLSQIQICRAADELEAWLAANPNTYEPTRVKIQAKPEAFGAGDELLSDEQKHLLAKLKNALIENERAWQTGQLQFPLDDLI
ncbi:hypothetical protein LP421_05210 [Rhizobium sp. RCAM05350]|nr:hypothetical protein LP421_05210 [Rhizobium sp. RCAM05350]